MNTHTDQSREPRCFVLIVTISLLVLLSMIALGFLSLSAVTLLNSSTEIQLHERTLQPYQRDEAVSALP